MNVAPNSNNLCFDYNNNKFNLNLKRYQIGFDHLFFSASKRILRTIFTHFVNSLRYSMPIFLIWKTCVIHISDSNVFHIQIIIYFIYYSNLNGATNRADDIFWFLIIFQKVEFICRMLNVEYGMSKGLFLFFFFVFSHYYQKRLTIALYVEYNPTISFIIYEKIMTRRKKTFLINKHLHVKCIFSHNFHRDCCLLRQT